MSSNTEFANYTPPRPKLNPGELFKFATLYWMISAATFFAIAILEENYGNGSFQRLIESKTAFWTCVVVVTTGTLLHFIVGGMTATTYDERVGGRSSGRRQRNFWSFASFFGAAILGLGIAMIV